jgi:regulator of sirC expression with transglutaminase-like and TPR domain
MKLAPLHRLLMGIVMAVSVFHVLPIAAASPSPSPYRLRALYNSLPQKDISKLLAFYRLYPDSDEGQKALSQAWSLLSGNRLQMEDLTLPSLEGALQAVVSLIHKPSHSASYPLADRELQLIDTLSQSLEHRKLSGHHIDEEAALLRLPPEEVDLARGLFISQLGNSPQALQQQRRYEAAIDLMALQIKALLPPQAAPEKIIETINHFIFFDLGFRFPPEALYSKEIDQYTFLPSVLESHRGVCLGVSILYMSLAQRLDFPLEMVTPPGHIYVRYRQGDVVINIETTARGIHLDSDEYLGINGSTLPVRNLKEVIGLAHFNHAATYLERCDYAGALKIYERALPYMPEDLLLKEFMGYCCLLTGDAVRGDTLLLQAAGHASCGTIYGETTSSDLLSGAGDLEGLRTLLQPVEKGRQALLVRQEALAAVVERCPRFRAAHFALATTWLQLHRQGEALKALERYHQLDSCHPLVEYYLVLLYAERWNFPEAWNHLHHLEKLTLGNSSADKILKALKQQLMEDSPESWDTSIRALYTPKV